MWVDPYMFVTLASGIALIAFAGQLCGIYIPYGEETSKLRIARAILAVSYLILSVPPFLELAAGGMPDKELIAIFTVAVAAFQSLLFTTTLLTLLNPKYVDRKKVTVQISAVTFAVAIYIALAVTVDSIWVYAAAHITQSYFIRNMLRPCGNWKNTMMKMSSQGCPGRNSDSLPHSPWESWRFSPHGSPLRFIMSLPFYIPCSTVGSRYVSGIMWQKSISISRLLCHRKNPRRARK